MPPAAESPKLNVYDFDTAHLEFSCLVGNQIRVFSEQFPGRELTTRVLSVCEGQMLTDSSNQFKMIGNLVSNQKVIVQFPYRDQWISVRALFKRSSGGRCYLHLGNTVSPLSQRKYIRLDIGNRIRLATVPLTGFQKIHLSRLRWMETDMHNFSSGGTLISVPSALEQGLYLVLNIPSRNIKFPSLVLGRVCHYYQHEDLHYRAGLEFAVREAARHLFPGPAARRFPTALFVYTNTDRNRINTRLISEKETLNEL